MIQRPYGRSGQSLSIIGFGGILVMNETQAHADSLVEEAVGRGINYFDVAPSYGDAEARLGPALRPFRDRVFLACKTGERLADKAEAELHGSLKQLETDHFDLYQFHGVTTLDEVDKILGKRGALDVFLKARDQGLIRHIGFSAHTEEAALRLMDAFPFESVLFPINYACWTQGQFGPRVVEKAQEKQVALLALKALARRPLEKDEVRKWAKCWYDPLDTPEDIQAALVFTLSQPVAAALTPGHAELFRMACEAADHLAGVPAGKGFNGRPLFSRD